MKKSANSVEPKKARIGFALEDKFGDQPLSQVFQQAISTLLPGEGGIDSRDAIWFAKWCLRAVSEAVIRDGQAAFPLEVSLLTPGRFQRQLPDATPKIIEVRFRRDSAA